jgi:orotidine-5'-phosphate decarboxylase
MLENNEVDEAATATTSAATATTSAATATTSAATATTSAATATTSAATPSHFKSIPAEERIIVALDCDAWEAIALADKLQGKARWLKIGMTLYYAEGPAIVTMFKRRGFKVFLDLKFHDIPHQVQGAARSAAASGADMLTMHTVGGSAMMEAGARGAAEGARVFGGEIPATLGITVLTSMSAEALAETGVVRPLPEQVEALAGQAQAAGLTGVVASPQEAARLRELLGEEAFIVTPGVRPAGAALGDQSRVATPRQAFEAGASHIVVGRPVTEATDPVAAFEALATEVRGL